MEIILTNGQVSPVDKCDYDDFNKFRWVMRQDGYVYRSVKQDGNVSCILMHRAILRAPLGMEVDHINRIRFDNRRDNLRIVTRQENAKNCSFNRNNKSGFRGVIWDNRVGKWKSNITSDKKRTFLGYFCDPIDAAKAYDRAAFEAGINPELLNFPAELQKRGDAI